MDHLYHIKIRGDDELSRFMEFKIYHNLVHEAIITTRSTVEETSYDYLIRLSDIQFLLLVLSCHTEMHTCIDKEC